MASTNAAVNEHLVPPVGDAAVPTMKARRKSLVTSTVGNLLEYYEWNVYAVFAPFIAAAMFNSEDPVSALLSTLAVFAVGFLIRPLGGLLFGRLADRKGRKVVFLTTILLMAGASLAIGLLPGYGSIGVWSSVLLLLLRLVQGMAHGGEAAVANTYVAEIAPPKRRGLWSSLVFIAVFGGSVIAYAVAGGVTSVMSDEAVSDWGWRIPFLLAAVMALVVLWLRRNMDESHVFEGKTDPDAGEATPAAPKPAVTGRSGRSATKRVMLVIALVAGLTTTHYTYSSYVSTYAITHKGMDADAAFWALLAAQSISVIAIPFFGMLSDRIGRKPIWITFGIVMFFLAIPMREMITDQPWTLFIPSAIVLILVAGPGSILSATMSEAFPTRMRTQGIGLAYSISIAAFGGSAPYLNAFALSQGVSWLASGYLMVLCLCTLTAGLLMRETKGIDLQDA